MLPYWKLMERDSQDTNCASEMTQISRWGNLMRIVSHGGERVRCDSMMTCKLSDILFFTKNTDPKTAKHSEATSWCSVSVGHLPLSCHILHWWTFKSVDDWRILSMCRWFQEIPWLKNHICMFRSTWASFQAAAAPPCGALERISSGRPLGAPVKRVGGIPSPWHEELPPKLRAIGLSPSDTA